MVTIVKAERRARYNPVVATTTFAVLDEDGAPAPIFDLADVAVYKDGILVTSGYSVTGTFNDGFCIDGAVVFVDGVTGQIDIVCDRGPFRTDQFMDGRGVPASDQNLAFNRLSAESREHYDKLARAHLSKFGSAGLTYDDIAVDHFYKRGADNTMVDGGSAQDIINAQANAAATEEDRLAVEAALLLVSSNFDTFPTRAAMAAIAGPLVNGAVYMLTEAGREGQFRLVVGDGSFYVAADPNQGFYFPHSSSPTGSAAYFARVDQSVMRPEQFGALGNAICDTDGQMTAGSATLISGNADFKASDVGKTIIVGSCGAAGAPLITTIAARVSSTQVTLAANAVTSNGLAVYSYGGTDDRNAIKAMFDFCVSRFSSKVEFTTGKTYRTDGVWRMYALRNVKINGNGATIFRWDAGSVINVMRFVASNGVDIFGFRLLSGYDGYTYGSTGDIPVIEVRSPEAADALELPFVGTVNTNINIFNNEFYGYRHSGVLVNGRYRTDGQEANRTIRIYNNKFERGCFAGFVYKSSRDVHFYHNSGRLLAGGFVGDTRAQSDADTTYYTCRDIFVHSNRFFNLGGVGNIEGRGILFKGGFTGVKVFNNVIDSLTGSPNAATGTCFGIAITRDFGLQSGDDITVMGNTVRSVTVDIGAFGGVSAAIPLLVDADFTNVRVLDNAFIDCDRGAYLNDASQIVYRGNQHEGLAKRAGTFPLLVQIGGGTWAAGQNYPKGQILLENYQYWKALSAYTSAGANFAADRAANPGVWLALGRRPKLIEGNQYIKGSGISLFAAIVEANCFDIHFGASQYDPLFTSGRVSISAGVKYTKDTIVIARGTVAYAGTTLVTNGITTLFNVAEADVIAEDIIDISLSGVNVYRECIITATCTAGNVSATAYNAYSASKVLAAINVNYEVRRRVL